MPGMARGRNNNQISDTCASLFFYYGESDFVRVTYFTVNQGRHVTYLFGVVPSGIIDPVRHFQGTRVHRPS